MVIQCVNITEYITSIESDLNNHANRQILYRGHSSLDYKLEPSVFRNRKWRESEHLMLRHLLSENPREFESDISTFDKLVRAQHYGLPTRLLDVSTNPFVALYFACCSNQKSDGKILIISSSVQRHKYFDSDTVSLLANLAYLRSSEREELMSYAKLNVPERATAAERIKAYGECPPLDRLIQTVRAEKSYFRAQVDPYDLAYVVSVTPRKSHDRIKAQEGQFLIFGMNEHDAGDHLNYLKITEIIVPSDAKQKIMSELSLLGVSERSLFPEIEKSAIQIRNRYR